MDLLNLTEEIKRLHYVMRHGDNRMRTNAQRDLLKHEAILAEEFGRLHGWQRSKHGFNLHQLSNGKCSAKIPGLMWSWEPIDHPYLYREREKPYRPSALVVHLYGDGSNWKLEEFCSYYGLHYRIVDDFPSWWNPGNTTLIVYIREPLPQPIKARRILTVGRLDITFECDLTLTA